MNSITSKFSAVFAIITSIILAGCAASPGVQMGDVQNVQIHNTANGITPDINSIIPINTQLLLKQRKNKENHSKQDVAQWVGTAAPYTIGAGDVLNIVVWDHPQLALTPATSGNVGNGYNVNTKGNIQFPYVGLMRVAGLTEQQVRYALTKRLSRYIKKPQITVRIQAYRSGRVYVDGEVKSPGMLNINDVPMTLPEAIARAGGFTETADRASIALTRKDNSTTINLPHLITNGINPSKILLRNGDLVRVMHTGDAKVYVLGEVTKPKSLALRDGRMTLNQALGEAGGVSTTTGNPRQIYVVRATGSAQATRPEIYHLNAKNPFAYALAEGFELQARDVVYVDPAPLVRWNRVLNLVLPSAQAVQLIRAATK